jgi:hypothetical protein
MKKAEMLPKKKKMILDTPKITYFGPARGGK